MILIITQGLHIAILDPFESRAETNTKNQYSNIQDYYSIRIRISVDVI
jgi:hypothetical protein